MDSPTPNIPSKEATTPLHELSPQSSLDELKNYAKDNRLDVSLAVGGSASRTKEQIYREIADEQIRKACLRDKAFAQLKLDSLSKNALLEYVTKHPQLHVSPQVGGPKARTLRDIYFDCVEAILRLPSFDSFNTLGPDTPKKDLQAFCVQYNLDTSIIRNGVSLDELYAEVTRAVVHRMMGSTFAEDDWDKEVKSLQIWAKTRQLDIDEDIFKSTRKMKTIYLKIGAALKDKILHVRRNLGPALDQESAATQEKKISAEIVTKTEQKVKAISKVDKQDSVQKLSTNAVASSVVYVSIIVLVLAILLYFMA